MLVKGPQCMENFPFLKQKAPVMSSASPALQFGVSQQKGAICSASRSCAGAEACSPHSVSMFYLEFLTHSRCLLGSFLLVSRGKRVVWAFAFIFLAFKYFSSLGCCALFCGLYS